jgi:DNA-binding transcriptional MerR regulator
MQRDPEEPWTRGLFGVKIVSNTIMADMYRPPQAVPDDDLVAIPRLAERTGVTARVLRYWEQLGLISPTREHGRLRYSPRDTAIARLTKRLVDLGVPLDGLRMLKELSEREVRAAGDGDDPARVTELALRLLYQRKAFREVTGTDEEHFPEPTPAPPPPGGPHPPPPPPGGPHPRPGWEGEGPPGPEGGPGAGPRAPGPPPPHTVPPPSPHHP